MVGQTLGVYRIVAELGAGGMGVVYQAHDTRLDRSVALKVLPRHSATIDPAAEKRLQTEARALARLNHPNVCTVYDVGEADGRTYIAMEHIQGRPLGVVVAAQGLPGETVAEYGVQISAALAHAHERGILHRDLKASNVIITDDGRAKVLDFGLAKLVAEAAAGDATRTVEPPTAPGTLMGTPPYMAPELFLGKDADARSDIWALGVLLHYAASGQLPFQGHGLEVGAAILHQSPAALPGHVGSGLRSVIQRCLTKDPAQRYQRAIEVRAALEVSRDAITEELTGTPAVTSQTAGRRFRAGAIGLLLIAGAIIGGWLFWRPAATLEATDTRLVSDFPGSHRSPSFSPDGTTVAFISAGENGPATGQVWVKNLARGSPLQLTSGNVAARRPVWSPKNDQIVFALQGQGIWSIPPLGGTPQRIIEAGFNPNFSADGEALVFERRRQIWTARSDGSQARLVHEYSAAYTIDAYPAFSRDGQSIVFFVAELGPNGDFWVVPTKGGEPRRLTNDLREGGMPVYTTDGRFIVFSSSRRGSRTLWRVPASGGEPTPLTTGAGEDLDPAFSRDGSSLLYVNVRNSWGLMLTDVTTGQPAEIYGQRNGLKFPTVSPKGDRIALFAQDPRGDAHVFMLGADGKDFRQVTQGAGLMNTMPFWSGDGDSLYYYQMRPAFSLRRLRADGGNDAEVAPYRWETHQAARIDPQNKTMAYLRQSIPDFKDAVMLRDLETGTESVFAEGDAHFHRPSWSRDGTRLLGWRHDGQLVVCIVANRQCTAIAKVPSDHSAAWSDDDRTIYFLRPTTPGPMRELWSVTPDGRDERKVAEIGPFFAVDVHFDVLGHDKVVWVQYREGRHELWRADMR